MEMTAGLETVFGPVRETFCLNVPQFIARRFQGRYEDLAIDLGTSKAEVGTAKKLATIEVEDLVTHEKTEVNQIPTWVTREKLVTMDEDKGKPDRFVDTMDDTRQIQFVGVDAYEMSGLHEDMFETVRAVQRGNIGDRRAYRAMARHAIEQVYPDFKSRFRGLRRPIILIGVPFTATEHHIAMIIDVFRELGAIAIPVWEQIAAAFGAGVTLDEPGAWFLADIGAGTIDCVVKAQNQFISPQSYPTGGDVLEACIIDRLKKTHGIEIDLRTATYIKEQIGSALPPPPGEDDPDPLPIRGTRGLVPRDILLTPVEIRDCIQPGLQRQVASLDAYIESFHAQFRIQSEILKNGIRLSGGGGLLARIADYYQQNLLRRTKDEEAREKARAALDRATINVTVVKDPQEAVIRGLQQMLLDKNKLKQGLANVFARRPQLGDFPRIQRVAGGAQPISMPTRTALTNKALK